MASAQVFPSTAASSRKQEHLEAGKRRLEEFRKKKAAERAKRASSVSQFNTVDAGLPEKQPPEAERVGLTNSDGASASNGDGGTVTESSTMVMNNSNNTTEPVLKNRIDSSYNVNVGPPFAPNNYEGYYGVLGSSGPVNFGHPEKVKNNNFGFTSGASGRIADGIATEKTMFLHTPSALDIDSDSNNYSYRGSNKTLSNDGSSHLKDFTVTNYGTSNDLLTNISPESSGSIPVQPTPGYADSLSSGRTSFSYENSVHLTPSASNSNFEAGNNTLGISRNNKPAIPAAEEMEHSGSVGHLTSANGASSWPSESRSMGFSFDARNSSNYVSPSPLVVETNARRSRPSFLDTINVPRISSGSSLPMEKENKDSFGSKVHPEDVSASSTLQNATDSSAAAGNGADLFQHGVSGNRDKKHDFYSQRQDEDFAALEQHIEDLTREKFSLQRALDASRTLAESLAAENSALTDSYNQQGSAVNQLKSDLEKLQEEIKAQLAELESVKIEYVNAQLECNAADERAKLLASEVIGLEEKALRLRSSELKLGRLLENSQAEILSFKKKMSGLEKDRMDLQSTIEALQEEKKLLQSKLRKASASGKIVDLSKSPTNKRDMSTSTEDLVERDDTDATGDTLNREMLTISPPETDAFSFSLWSEKRQFNLEGSYLNIPPDQTRKIQNINTLISELALEKEELIEALSAESSQSSKLKELNKELSRKLEAQTQRLELLTAQSMVHDNIPARQPLDTRTVNDNTQYADEGDEVVERVLGWIMKLFPGGPSRRRTSKLL